MNNRVTVLIFYIMLWLVHFAFTFAGILSLRFYFGLALGMTWRHLWQLETEDDKENTP